MKEAEEALRPLLMKLYASEGTGSTGATGPVGEEDSQSSSAPKVEEVD
jgi:hypothetical protein